MTAVSRRRSIELRLGVGRWSRSLTRIRFPRRDDVGAPYDKRVPCGSTWKAGGLMSYATDLADQYRLAAGYVDQILRGAKPTDLPVQAPTRFETVITLWEAKAIGLAVPASLLVRADEVIE